jgi:hypothetical protein
MHSAYILAWRCLLGLGGTAARLRLGVTIGRRRRCRRGLGGLDHFLLVVLAVVLGIAANVLLDIAVLERLGDHLDDEHAPEDVEQEEDAEEHEEDAPEPPPRIRRHAHVRSLLLDRHDDVVKGDRVDRPENVVPEDAPAHEEPHECKRAKEKVGQQLPLEVHKDLGCWASTRYLSTSNLHESLT